MPYYFYYLVTHSLLNVDLILNHIICFEKTGVLRQIVCFLVDNDAMLATAAYGSVYGLVVITAERYFKIVHPVAHRNHYRRWMTYVGVAAPWLTGLLSSALPYLTWTRFVDGTCKTTVCSTTSFSTLCLKINVTLFIFAITLSDVI